LSTVEEQTAQLEAAIAALEAQRAILGDAVVEAAIAPMREKLATLARAEALRPELEGERKLVTIMFADISGFTALAETMDSEAVHDLMWRPAAAIHAGSANRSLTRVSYRATT
jgi:class 3 adenylate cyclase